MEGGNFFKQESSKKQNKEYPNKRANFDFTITYN